ncbi:37S ribosomal protein S22 [Agyrium rufum]|nr:37S ribosomal protein S22 [Agyrium rufum]
MLAKYPKAVRCGSCQSQLLAIFIEGLSTTQKPAAFATRRRITRLAPLQAFNRLQCRGLRTSPARKLESQLEISTEDVVRAARQIHGEYLPQDALSAEEYAVYERLYGAPPPEPEDVDETHMSATPSDDSDPKQNLLLRETADGSLEEVVTSEEPLEELQDVLPEVELVDLTASEQVQKTLYQDMVAAGREPMMLEDQGDEMGPQEVEVLEEEENEGPTRSDAARTHPLTYAGRYETSPSTLPLPSHFVEMVNGLLANASNKQLKEVSQRVFGGWSLPNSAATPRHPRGTTPPKQAPIALEAGQQKMGEMEANAFVAAIMPGVYTSVMSVLVEVRKRLGKDWLTPLLHKDGGPRILDAGGGGAGVIAWREIIKAEWATYTGSDPSRSGEAPLGKATVITGSDELRHRASSLLENTTFLPRLPDYSPTKHHPTIETQGGQPLRKQYDIIIAPHTLFGLKEDYLRKAQVENFWSLLNPHGGVLVLLEKGLTRGFECIAGARELLLKKHISSPGTTKVENELQGEADGRFSEKGIGMIIAPCTNHSQCPMYTFHGKATGRKDHCSFSQRYKRPQWLQRILNAKESNHEDIRFSYIAVQRGKDKRIAQSIEQDDAATNRAFDGFLQPKQNIDLEGNLQADDARDASHPLMQALPRIVSQPLKGTGHITLDLCTPAGKLERWIVPKSYGRQAYRDARKSQWGDLWALGAKTRTVRVPKNGEPANRKKLNKPKTAYAVEVGQDEEEDRIKEMPVKGSVRKRDKKGENLGRRHLQRLIKKES